MSRLWRPVSSALILVSIIILFLPSGFASAVQVEETPTETPLPTETPAPPTDTQAPIESPTETPSDTPAPPSETPVPTDTPLPSETLVPTETAEPSATPTATETPTRVSVSPLDQPRLSWVLNRLADSYLEGGPVAAADFASSFGLLSMLTKSNENVLVTGKLAAGKTVHDARQVVATMSGWVEADAADLVQMNLPIRNLRPLAESGVFAGVKLPAVAKLMAGTYNSEGVSTSGASVWHAEGITGRGVKVAVLDGGFSGYSGLLGSELPPASRVHTRSFRSDGSMVATSHGTLVAETVYDMAPGIELWLVSFQTDVEFAEAVDWLIAQGVQVINASFGWIGADDGDGNGFLIDSVNRAKDAGILFVAAAGNEALGHYEGAFSPSGSYHDWNPGPGVSIYNQLGFTPTPGQCYWLGTLTWDDWGDTAPGVDFDVEVYEDFGYGWEWTYYGSFNDQSGGYPWPSEDVGFCSEAGGPVAIAIYNYSGGMAGDYFEWYGWASLQYGETPASSLTVPADAPDAFSVGGHDWLTGSLEPYSSRGPVNAPGGGPPGGGEAVKPDISGPDCTTTKETPEFCGTSAAAPHVSGAAALVLQAFPGDLPNDIRLFLEGRAVDQGTPGKDNLWGAGKLAMGAVPDGPAACTPGEAVCAADKADAWPLFQNVPARTGAGQGTVDSGASLQWAAGLGADVRSVVLGPANDDTWPRGLAHVVAGRYVYGVDPISGVPAWSDQSGEWLEWKFDLGTAGAATGQAAPAVTDYDDGGTPGDGGDDSYFVYVGSGDGYVYKFEGIDGDWVAYDENDDTTWGQQLACKSADLGTNLSKASPVIGTDGTVYFVDDAAVDRLIAVNPNCSQKWAIDLGAGAGTSSPVYWANPANAGTVDDLIFVGADKLYAVTIWGGIKWSQPLKTGAETAAVPSTPLVIDPGGTWKAYAVNSLGDLYTMVASTGVVERVYDAPAGAHGMGSLAAYNYTGSNYYLSWGHLGLLYRYDTSTVGATTLTLGGSLTDASPVVDAAGNVFIGSSDGKVYGVNGSTMAALAGWPKVAGVSTAAGLAISPLDGWLYVPSSDDNLRAYGPLPGGCPTCVADPQSDWPLFQHDQANTGVGAQSLPSSPALLWNRAPGGDVFPPVVGEYGLSNHPQGIAYFVTGRYVRALDLATRSLLWSYDLGVAGTPVGFAAPAVVDQTIAATYFDDGVVYVGAKDGFLHAIHPLWGYTIWKTDVGLDISKASPTIGDDGTVYVVEDAAVDRLIAVAHTGAVRWSAPIGAALGTSSPAYDSASDCVFVGGNNLYGFAASGAACTGWSAAGYKLGATSTSVPSAPLISGTNVYALNNLGDLYRLPLAGGGATLVYDTPTGTGSGSLAYDSGGGAGGYLYWTLAGKLYRWDIAGASAVSVALSGATANSTPVIDGSGTVFVGTGDNKLWRLARGSTTPSVIRTTAGSMASAGAITHNPKGGVLLWPSADDNLYGFGTPEGLCSTCSLAGGYWPMLQSSATHDFWLEVHGGGTNIRESRVYSVTGAVRPPVVDEANNRLYFVAGQYLYARDLWGDYPVWWQGDLEKKYNLGVAVTSTAYAMPALGKDTSRPSDDQIIIFVGGSDGVLHAVRASNGDLLWKTDVGNNISKASPAVSDGGHILVVEENTSPNADRLIVLDFKGSVVWWKPIGDADGTSSPAINDKGTAGDPGDDIVVVGGGGGLYAFNLVDGGTPAGWSSSLVPIGVTNGAPFVAYQSGVFDEYYVVTKAGELVWVDSDGAYEVLADVPGTGKSAAPASVWFCNEESDPCTAGWTKRIFFGVGNTLYQYFHDDLYNDGLLRSVVLGGDLGDSTPLFGDDAVYIASSDQKFYAVDNMYWITGIGWVSPPTGGSMSGAGAFLSPWTLLWPGSNGKLHVYESGGGDSSAPEAALGQWPLFQRNALHLGKSPSALPSSPVEQWAVLGAGDAKPPVIGETNQPFNDGTYPDGVAYFVAGRYLYALDVRTHLVAKRWDLGATSGVLGYASPAVIRLDPQNTPGDPNDDEVRIVVADKNGFVKMAGSWWWEGDYGWWDDIWTVVDVGSDASKASPLAGRNNFIYVMEDAAVDRIHAINHWNGAIAWSTALGAGPGSSSPAYYDGSPDRVFVGADSLYAVNANTGSILWSRNLGSAIGSSPLVLDLDGTSNDAVYVLTSAAKLYRIPVTGGPSSPAPLATITGTVGAASMAAYEYDVGNEYFYLFFGVGNKLYRYDTNGGAPTSLTLGTLATNFANSTPLVDVSGKVYIGGADGWLFGVDGLTMTALTPAWNPIDGSGWPKRIGLGTTASSAAGSLAMDANGYLYVPSMDDNLRRFGPAEPSACADCDLYSEGQWPKFQHDAPQTGLNSIGAGHRTPIVYWTRTTLAPLTPPRTPVLGPPVYGYEGGGLFYTSGQYLLAREASGPGRWAFDLGAAGNPSGGASPGLLVVDDGGDGCTDEATCSNDTVWVIVGAKDGFLYAINAYPDLYNLAEGWLNPEMIWRTDLGGDISKASPAIGPDGTVYVVEDATPNDKLHAVYWNGTRWWTQTLGAGTGASSPAIDTANNRIFVGSANKIYAFELSSGAAIAGWPIQIGTTGTVNTSPVLFGGKLWVLNSLGDLYNLDPAGGAQTPAIVYGDTVGAVGDGVAPAVQHDPYTEYDVIAFGAGTRFYQILWDSASNTWMNWQWRATKGTVGNTSAAIDDNGWSYIFDSAGYLTAYYRYATWWNTPLEVFCKKIASQGTLAGGVVISNNGMLFVPSRNNTIYGLGAP